MSGTSQIASIEECHSSQPTAKRDASKRIPRPPNAFMLYRSDLLRRRAIPPEVEKHQQNLSRIAGQCWNMLPETEKAIWFAKAAVIRAEHYDKYPFYKTAAPCKETKRHARLSAKDKRKGSATDSTHSSGRLRARRTRMPYCEGIFTAPHGSNSSSPESKASLSSPTLVSESLLSTPASPSPLTAPYSLSPFTSTIHSSRQDSSSTAYSSMRGDKFDHLLGSPGSDTTHCRLSHMAPREIGISAEPYPVPQHHDDFSFSVPCLEPPKPQKDPFAQIPLTLPMHETYLSENLSLLSDLHVVDPFAHFTQSLGPLYPWCVEGPNTSN